MMTVLAAEWNIDETFLFVVFLVVGIVVFFFLCSGDDYCCCRWCGKLAWYPWLSTLTTGLTLPVWIVGALIHFVWNTVMGLFFGGHIFLWEIDALWYRWVGQWGYW